MHTLVDNGSPRRTSPRDMTDDVFENLTVHCCPLRDHTRTVTEDSPLPLNWRETTVVYIAEFKPTGPVYHTSTPPWYVQNSVWQTTLKRLATSADKDSAVDLRQGCGHVAAVCGWPVCQQDLRDSSWKTGPTSLQWHQQTVSFDL